MAVNVFSMRMYAQGHLLKPSPLGGGRWQQIFDLLTDEGMKDVCPEGIFDRDIQE